jgi:hypothetical protein
MKASGWPRVRSLAGGIDAWSEQVDPEVPATAEARGRDSVHVWLNHRNQEVV